MTSSTLSSMGVGSGLDVTSIIKSLMAVEHRPVDLLATEQTTLSTTLSSMGKMQSYASTMGDKAQALADLSLWSKKSFTSSDSTAVAGSAEDGTAAGSYSVSVQALASSQTLTSGAFSSSSATLSEGTLTIELGTWGSGSPASGFTAKDGSSALNITIGPDDTSLTSVRDKINAAGAGVTASIVTDANGSRLSLRSTATGAENGFRITASETSDDGDAGTGLSALAYDATASSNTMTRNLAAGNAKATVNGIQVESSTNTFSTVAEGVTFTVGKVTGDATTEITITDNTDAVTTGIKDFVKAFNDLASYIKDQTKYDETAKKGAPLQGDRTAIGFQWQMRGIINDGTKASSSLSHLSDIGISMAADGTLKLDSAKLETAMKNPAEVRKALATDGADAESSGFMDRFRDLADAATASDGSLQTRQDALNAAIKRNQSQQDSMEARLVGVQARYEAQYQALDTQMASLNALSSYVTQQMAALSSSS
ncbi:flagellar filament capping protein FliD [Ideonella azotifigens]|uniref:Flagellar hook-associated protein 2 n=1 Tax=Ideonella azotifigens TaxID=513160 RepID=A0ABN1K789_9BURK|nr:flagellar filament capping protein FliD [Ideonella azotifigens]MCD2342248.1 flagellar filament capping protein FliD [Ideonella azotifigens]